MVPQREVDMGTLQGEMMEAVAWTLLTWTLLLLGDPRVGTTSATYSSPYTSSAGATAAGRAATSYGTSSTGGGAAYGSTTTSSTTGGGSNYASYGSTAAGGDRYSAAGAGGGAYSGSSSTLARTSATYGTGASYSSSSAQPAPGARVLEPVTFEGVPYLVDRQTGSVFTGEHGSLHPVGANMLWGAQGARSTQLWLHRLQGQRPGEPSEQVSAARSAPASLPPATPLKCPALPRTENAVAAAAFQLQLSRAQCQRGRHSRSPSARAPCALVRLWCTPPTHPPAVLPAPQTTKRASGRSWWGALGATARSRSASRTRRVGGPLRVW
jgi:hypothetical protein